MLTSTIYWLIILAFGIVPVLEMASNVREVIQLEEPQPTPYPNPLSVPNPDLGLFLILGALLIILVIYGSVVLRKRKL